MTLKLLVKDDTMFDVQICEFKFNFYFKYCFLALRKIFVFHDLSRYFHPFLVDPDPNVHKGANPNPQNRIIRAEYHPDRIMSVRNIIRAEFYPDRMLSVRNIFRSPIGFV